MYHICRVRAACQRGPFLLHPWRKNTEETGLALHRLLTARNNRQPLRWPACVCPLSATVSGPGAKLRVKESRSAPLLGATSRLAVLCLVSPPRLGWMPLSALRPVYAGCRCPPSAVEATARCLGSCKMVVSWLGQSSNRTGSG